MAIKAAFAIFLTLLFVCVDAPPDAVALLDFASIWNAVKVLEPFIGALMPKTIPA